MNQTALVLMPDGHCYEYPVSERRRLMQRFRVPSKPIGLVWMTWNEGVVYGYIENRRKEFKHPHYGWELPR